MPARSESLACELAGQSRALAQACRDEGFAAALLDPDAPVPEGLPARRYSIYRNNVTAALVRALGDAYPAVKVLVGDAFFNAAAALFVRAHPPRSPLMIEYGADFPDWLAGFPPASGVPYLPDVARLERAWLASCHAADAEPLPATALAALLPEVLMETRLALHPSLCLVRSRFPVVALWQQATGRAARAPVDLAEAQTARVVRPHLDVTVAAMGPAAVTFVGALRKGLTLGAAAEAAALRGDFDLAAEIAALFAGGLVAAIRSEGS
jgi:hypothetical protein